MSEASNAASSADYHTRLNNLLELRAGPRIEPLIALGREVAAATGVDGSVGTGVIHALLELLEGYAGNNRQRMDMGEVLGLLGDPRLRSPADADYWQRVELPDGEVVEVGRFPVTTAEFQRWAVEGAVPWTELAASPDSADLVVPNQPVAGVTWFEAESYASAMGARLLTAAEHRAACRGGEKRPYPWGAPFGDGNANTKEEALGRPCAVGVFASDRTPEGICDLAGNVGCWLQDGTEDGQRMLHPGSWARPSMAAWAKALEMADPGARSADLGFRLARDLS